MFSSRIPVHYKIKLGYNISRSPHSKIWGGRYHPIYPRIDAPTLNWRRKCLDQRTGKSYGVSKTEESRWPAAGIVKNSSKPARQHRQCSWFPGDPRSEITPRPSVEDANLKLSVHCQWYPDISPRTFSPG